MEPELLNQELERILEGLGIIVRYESLGDSETPATSGVCTVRGTTMVIINRSSDPSERARVLGRTISRLDLEDVYMKPAVREFVESLGRTGGEEGSEGKKKAAPDES